jgi:hypothetical protein
MEEKEILEAILKELKKGSAGPDPLGTRGPSMDLRDTASDFDEEAAKAQVEWSKARKVVMDAEIAAGEVFNRVKQAEYEVVSRVSEANAENVGEVKGLITNYIKLTKEMEKGSMKAKNATSQMFKLSGAANTLNELVPTSTEQWMTFGTELIESARSGKLFVAMAAKLIGTMINIAVATDKATASFAAYSGVVGNGNHLTSKYGQILSKTERQAAVFGATHADIAGVQQAMFGNYQNYTSLSGDQAIALGKQTAALKKLGVAEQLTTQIFDTATKSLGFNDDELVGLTQTLHDTALSIGKPTAQVAADFADVSKKLAFHGTDVVGIFQNLEKQSKATGLSVSDLVGVSGEAFDTFDGAAEKVGRLNAILGGPYLNSIDMLNASEDERLEMINASMDASGQMFSELGKYEQKAIASALGVEVDVARRMFGNLSAAEEIQIRKQEEVAETARKAQEVMDKLKNAFYSLVVAVNKLFAPFTWAVEKFSQFTEWLNEGDSAAKKAFKWILNLTVLFGGLWGSLKMAGKAIAKPAKALRKLGVHMRVAGESGTFLHKTGTTILKLGHRLGSMGGALLKPFTLIGKAFRAFFGLFARGAARMSLFSVGIRSALLSVKAFAAAIPVAGWAVYLIIAAVETFIFSLNNLWAIFKSTFKLIGGIVTGDGAKISEAFNTIMENIAMIWYKGLNALTFGLFGLIVKWAGGKEKILKIFKVLAITVFSPLIIAVKALGLVFKGLWFVVKTTFKAIGALFMGLWKVAKIVFFGITLPIRIAWELIKTVFGGIKKLVGTTITAFKDAFAPVIDAFKGIGASFGKAWGTIKKAIQPIKDAFASIGEAFASMFGGGGGGGGGFLDAAFSGIKVAFGFIMKVVLLPLKAVFGFLGLAIKGFAILVQIALTPIVWLFKGIGLAIEVMAKIIGFALSPVVAIFEFIKFIIGGVASMFKFLGKVIMSPVTFIQKMFDMLPKWIVKRAMSFLGIGGDTSDATADVPGEKVDDVIITSSGKVIKPSKKDTIIAAKPGSSLLQPQAPDPKRDGALSFANPLEGVGDKMANLTAKVLGASPLGMLLKAGSGMAGMAGKALGGAPDGEQGPPNVKVDVNVKIGEKQLTDIIIEALSSPEAGKAISPFLN